MLSTFRRASDARLDSQEGQRWTIPGERLWRARVDISIVSQNAALKGWYKKIGFVEGESKVFPYLQAPDG
jgi:hypothetical protein